MKKIKFFKLLSFIILLFGTLFVTSISSKNQINVEATSYIHSIDAHGQLKGIVNGESLKLCDGNDNDLSTYQDTSSVYVTNCSSFYYEITNHEEGYDFEYWGPSETMGCNAPGTIIKDNNSNTYNLDSSKRYKLFFQYLGSDGGLFVKITYQEYPVVYDANAGDDEVTGEIPTDTNKYVILEEVPISGNDLSRNGYNFLGWNTDKDATSTVSTPYYLYTSNLDNNTLVLYAVWQELPHTVTFNLSDGKGTTPTDTSTYVSGNSITLPDNANFSKEDCEFKGWNSDPTATTGYTGSYTITKNDVKNGSIKFYAIWEENFYTKAFKMTFPSITSVTEAKDIAIVTDCNDELVIEEIKIIQPTADGEGQEYTDSISKPGVYMILVIYNVKSGKPFKTNDNHFYILPEGQKMTFSNCECGGALVAKSFDFTKEIGTEEFTIAGTDEENTKLLFSLLVFIEGGSKVAYASNSTEVVTGFPDDSVYFNGTEITLPTNIERTGYNLLGYAKTSTATTPEFTTKYTVSEDDVDQESEKITLYAIWQEKEEVSITTTSQVYNFDEAEHAFEIKGTTATNFVVEYLTGQNYTETAPKRAGTYDVKITHEEDSSHKYYQEIIVAGLVINHCVILEKEITLCEDNFTYNGQNQYESITATFKGVNSKDIELKVSNCRPSNSNKSDPLFIDAGEYEVSFRCKNSEDLNNYRFVYDDDEGRYYNAYFNMKPYEVAIDWSENNYTYNGNVLKVSATYKDVYNATIDLSVTTANEFKNAGNYVATASFKNSETNYALPTVATKNYTIKKCLVNEPVVTGTYKYTGKPITVSVTGVEAYMSTTDSLTQTNAGEYVISYTLNDNYAWNEGQDGKVMWKIKPLSITPKKDEQTPTDKEEVIVSTEDGFDNNITIKVEVTVEVEVETKKLTVDYYNISLESAKLQENEIVGVVYDVKLIRTIDGIDQVIQPSDIAPGTKIKVKMLIPDDVDISKVTRILHVHSADDIQTLEFDASLVDSNRYYEIEIDRLSEFAFIYEKDAANNCITHWFSILLLVLLLGFVAFMWFVLKIKNLKNEDNKFNLIPLIGFGAHFVILVVLAILSRCAICVVFDILNLLALVGAVLLYYFYKENKKEEN